MAEVIGNADTPIRADTAARMDFAREKKLKMLPLTWIVTGVCCFWLPLCCFLAAANVLPTCEKPKNLFGQEQYMDNFLKEYSLWIVLTGPVVQTIICAAAFSGVKFCFKFAEQLNLTTGGVQLG